MSWLRSFARKSSAKSVASRDNHLTIRSVERRQHLIERLHAAADRITVGTLARDFGVSKRTIARDIERLRQSGVPIDVTTGRGGGVAINRHHRIPAIAFDLREIATLMASLTALGPTTSPSAASAMDKLATALTGGRTHPALRHGSQTCCRHRQPTDHARTARPPPWRSAHRADVAGRHPPLA
ncbi:helix-turn-helix transcriptional regulator [Nonomuraea sp. NPDC050227]|uniref:helix-turn-helix transcriptional regulator n=1 Tax=unclassified Nonomuraea TaxID=2593643 RepID=UPI00331E60A8